MIVGYLRVSTASQDLGLQREALLRAGCERFYEETASGAQRDRPQLAQAIAFMRPGDTLVVWKLDRLARSLRQLLETVGALDARGIGFRSVTESIDTTSAGGRLVFHMFGALAEFERELIRERTNAGLANARKHGRIGGRPKALSEADVRAARAMLSDDEVSVRDVARRLGVSVPTLYRYLPGGRIADAQ